MRRHGGDENVQIVCGRPDVVDLVTHVLKRTGELLEEFSERRSADQGFEIAEENGDVIAEVMGGRGEVSGIDGSKHRGDRLLVRSDVLGQCGSFRGDCVCDQVIATSALRVNTDVLTSRLSGWLRR
jgi:hypothetical protein